MTDEKKPELSIQEMPVTPKTLTVLSNSPTIPKAYQGRPADMLAVALQGRELGIGPMTAINNIDMIDGTISMRAKLMSALIFGAGHVVKTEEQTAEVCKLRCFRWHNGLRELIELGVVEYTIEDARTAGDTGKATYKKHPKAMLTNRALTLAARTFYGDVLAGIGYTPDEVGINAEPDDIPVELLKQELDATVIEDDAPIEVQEVEVVS